MNHFTLLERITDCTPEQICAEANFVQMHGFAGLESMAQLAALHVRYRLDFRRHAFLLNVIQCQMPARGSLDGHFSLWAKLSSQSNHAFAYKVNADCPARAAFDCQLLIGTQDYGDRFRQARLQTHYQALFNALAA